jgi:hypothetical protein
VRGLFEQWIEWFIQNDDSINDTFFL